MLADYQKVVKILEKANTQQVSSAEYQLKQLVVGNIQMLACLHTALKDKLISHQTKILATSFINSTIIENRIDYRQDTIFRLMSDLLKDQLIEIKYKKLLLRSLTAIMETNDTQHLFQWEELAYQILKDTNLFQQAFLVVTALAGAQVSMEIIYQIIDNLFLLSFQNNIFVSPSPDSWIQIESIIITWKMVLDTLINDDSETAHDYIRKMSNTETFCHAIYQIYDAFASVNNYFCLESESIKMDYVEKINEIKTDTALMHLKILMQVWKYQENSFLLQVTGMNIEKLVNSLFLGALSYDYISNNGGDIFLLHLLQILKHIFEIMPEIFVHTWKHLIHQILIPFLQVSSEEMDDFHNNPQAFLELFEDCCESQKIQNIKTQSAQFLEKLSDLSHRISHQNVQVYIVNQCMVSIKHHLFMQQLQTETEFRPFPLQVSFQVLSIFSFGLSANKTPLEQLRIILCDDRVTKLPPLELTRIFMFLAYNYSEVFLEPMSGYHWMKLAMSSHGNSTVQYCALDFVFNTIESIYHDEIVEGIILKIPQNLTQNFWHLVRKILKYHLPKIPQELTIKMINVCLYRFQKELERLKNVPIKKTYDLINILQAARSIVSQEEYISTKLTLKNRIWEFVKYYQEAVKHNFQDQMINLVNIFLNACTPQEIHQTQYMNFLSEFLVNFKMEYLPQNHYFITLNNYIIKGQFTTVVYPVFKLIKETLSKLCQDLNENPSALRQKIVIGHHMILFENVIYRSGGNLPNQDADEIYNLMKKFFPQVKVDEQTQQIQIGDIFDKHLLSRAINIQYLLCLCQNQGKQSIPSEMIQTLNTFHHLKIYYGHDAKILLLCIKEHIKKENDIQIIKTLLSILTRSVFYYLQRIRTEKELEKKYKEENQRNPSTKIMISKTVSYEGLLKFIKTPFADEERGRIRDKYRQLMNELKNKNEYLFEGITKSMDEQVQIQMQRIMRKPQENRNQQKSQMVELEMSENRKTFKISGIKAVSHSRIEQQNDGMIIEQLGEQSQEENGGTASKRRNRKNCDEEDESDQQLKVRNIVRKRRKKCHETQQ